MSRVKSKVVYEQTKRPSETIKWSKRGPMKWTSGDLSFVMYDIAPIKIER